MNGPQSTITDHQDFTGFHGLVSSAMAIEGAETALKLTDLRKLVDLVRPKPDFFLMSRAIANRLDWAAMFGSGIPR